MSGFVLVMTTALLLLLIGTGLAFLMISNMDRGGTRSSVEHSRASLLSLSGMERALSEVSRLPALVPYGGEDWNGDGVQAALVMHPERQSQMFRPGSFEISECPLEYSLRPSFYACRREWFEGTVPAPDRILIDGVLRSYSGRLRGTLADGSNSAGHIIRGDTYTLRVDDESSKINVNGGFLDEAFREPGGVPDYADTDVVLPTGESVGWNRQLVRILDTLGIAKEDANGNAALNVGEDWDADGVLDPAPVNIPGLGTLVVLNRPAGGYTSVQQVQELIGFPNKDLSPYLTVASWVDRKVIRPNAWRQIAYDPFASDRKKSRLEITLEEGGRPPVNLNAAHPAVLYALIQGITAPRELSLWSISMSQVFTPSATYSFTPIQASKLVTAFAAARRVSPFQTWMQFQSFLEGPVTALPALSAAPTAVTGFPVATAAPGTNQLFAGQLGPCDMVRANFDPNTGSQLQSPDECMTRWMDKTDLTEYSTEGTFHPTGTYRVLSLGRLIDANGAVRASRNIDVHLEAFSLLRHTTQRDFMAGRMPDGTNTSCFSPATSGRTTGASATWAVLPSLGVSTMTYPCPMQAVAAGRAAEFDGYVGLATTEILHEPEATFIHHFDDGWTADVAISNAGRVTPTPLSAGPPVNGFDVDAKLTAPENQSVWPRAVSGVAVEPNTLCPDGVHLQPLRYPAFSKENFPPDDTTSDHATFTFWSKPRIAGSSLGYQIYFSCARYGPTLPAPGMPGQPTQVFLIGWIGAQHGALYECARNTSDSAGVPSSAIEGYQSWNRSAYRAIDARWTLFTAFLDSDADHPRNIMSYIRGAIENTMDPNLIHTVTEARGYIPVLPLRGFGTTLQEKLDVPSFVIGSQVTYPANQMPAYTFLDEFAILNYGDDAITAETASNDAAAARYADGRYYKGNDGKFLSADLVTESGGVGIRLLQAWWTEHLPTDSRKDVVWTGGPPPDYTYSYYQKWVDPLLRGNDATGKPRIRLEIGLTDTAGIPLAVPLLTQGGRIGITFPGVRYRVIFRTALSNLADPLLETPFLDDITFAYQRASGPRVLSWRGG